VQSKPNSVYVFILSKLLVRKNRKSKLKQQFFTFLKNPYTQKYIRDDRILSFYARSKVSFFRFTQILNYLSKMLWNRIPRRISDFLQKNYPDSFNGFQEKVENSMSVAWFLTLSINNRKIIFIFEIIEFLYEVESQLFAFSDFLQKKSHLCPLSDVVIFHVISKTFGFLEKL
jgi:hypothetical protein